MLTNVEDPQSVDYYTEIFFSFRELLEKSSCVVFLHFNISYSSKYFLITAILEYYDIGAIQ